MQLMRWLGLIFLRTVGCAHTTVRFQGGPPVVDTVSGPISVLVLPGPALPPDSAGFPTLLLEIAGERDRNAELVYGAETAASRVALDHGARFLLVATVQRWRDAETQYSGEPDRVEIALKLMRLQPAGLVREFQFSARSSQLAVRDAAADRLLGYRFRQAVRELLGYRRVSRK